LQHVSANEFHTHHRVACAPHARRAPFRLSKV
jgi:hypothetical protein